MKAMIGHTRPKPVVVYLGGDPARSCGGGRSLKSACPTCGWQVGIEGLGIGVMGLAFEKKRPRWPKRSALWEWCPECAAWWPMNQVIGRAGWVR